MELHPWPELEFDSLAIFGDIPGFGLFRHDVEVGVPSHDCVVNAIEGEPL
jgi:hypothetical protein